MKRRANMKVTFELLHKLLNLDKNVQIAYVNQNDRDKESETFTVALIGDETSDLQNTAEGNYIVHMRMDTLEDL